MSDSECNAPCVINVAMGFYLVFCDGEYGHNGEHFHRIPSVQLDAVAKWSYHGYGDDSVGGVSPPSMVTDRCQTWVRTKELARLERNPRAQCDFSQPLVIFLESNGDTTAFCCEKKPGHDGEHVRRGVFSPLSVVWSVTW